MDIQRMIVQVLPASFFNFTESFQKILKMKISADDQKSNLGGYSRRYDERELFETSPEKQMKAWKENPTWLDETPDIKVSVPKGSLCRLTAKANIGLHPDAVYDIFTDPDNKRVFKNIKEVISRKVLVDDGLRQVVEVEQEALWKFLWWSGTISVHVLVDQNRRDHSMQFKQLKAGFMKKFEGSWRVEPVLVDEETCSSFKPSTLKDYCTCTKGKGRIGSKVSLDQLVQPALLPPPPISWYLRGITAKTTEVLMNDLLAEAARIKTSSLCSNSRHAISEGMSDQNGVDELRHIKARWALRRRSRKQCRRRLLLNAASSSSSSIQV